MDQDRFKCFLVGLQFSVALDDAEEAVRQEKTADAKTIVQNAETLLKESGCGTGQRVEQDIVSRLQSVKAAIDENRFEDARKGLEGSATVLRELPIPLGEEIVRIPSPVSPPIEPQVVEEAGGPALPFALPPGKADLPFSPLPIEKLPVPDTLFEVQGAGTVIPPDFQQGYLFLFMRNQCMKGDIEACRTYNGGTAQTESLARQGNIFARLTLKRLMAAGVDPFTPLTGPGGVEATMTKEELMQKRGGVRQSPT